MFKRIVALLLLSGCTANPSIDLNSTFVVDSHFNLDEQAGIVRALDQWEQTTHGIVNMKLIITDTPSMYAPLPEIIKETYVDTHDNVLGRTEYTADQTIVHLFANKIVDYNINIENVAMHEMGHAFGLRHRSVGLMIAVSTDQLCIDDNTLQQFCDIHNCNMSEVKSDCDELK